jgi:hypothetical protein
MCVCVCACVCAVAWARRRRGSLGIYVEHEARVKGETLRGRVQVCAPTMHAHADGCRGEIVHGNDHQQNWLRFTYV